MFQRLDSLLRLTPTKEFANAPLLGVMLDDPLLPLLENDREEKWTPS